MATANQRPPAATVAAARRGGVLKGLTEVGELTRFSAEALKQTPGSARYFGEILRQAASLVRGSTPMIALMAAFIGFSATNFGYRNGIDGHTG
jgi:ABC-type transporter Mla maintaining outer membrane lipid asymmetry permease subunit MlaE